MNKFLLFIFFFIIIKSNGQVSLLNSIDITGLVQGSVSSINPYTSSAGVYIAKGDSVLVEVSSVTGAFTPTSGFNTNQDTLTGLDFWSRGYTIDNAANETATLTIYNKYYSYDLTYRTLAGGSAYDRSNEGTESIPSANRLFKFVEGETDTLVFVNNSNQDIYTRLFQMRPGSQKVISDKGNDLFKNSDFGIVNPVKDGTLNLSIDKDAVFNFELLTMDAMTVLSKTISGGEERYRLNVSSVKKGMYLLRESKSGSIRKIIIQ